MQESLKDKFCCCCKMSIICSPSNKQKSQNDFALKCPDQIGSSFNNYNTIFGIDQTLFIILTVLVGTLSLGLALYCKYFRKYGFSCFCFRDKTLDSYVKSTGNDGYFDDVATLDEDDPRVIVRSYQDEEEGVGGSTVSDDEQQDDEEDAVDAGVEMVER